MKTLKVLGLVMAVVFIGSIIKEVVMGGSSSGGNNATTSPASTEKVVKISLDKFADDPGEIHSNLYNEEVHLYKHMPEVEFTLGSPNKGPWSSPDPTCDSQPVIWVVYSDMMAMDKEEKWLDRKSYALVYQNLYCQPDDRAYVLVGMHPIPGLWWDTVKAAYGGKVD